MKCFLRRMRENSHTERERHDLGRAAILHKLVSASATDVFSSSSSRVLPQARRASRIVPLRLVATGLLVATAGFMVTALGALPSWVRNIEAGSAIEAVFFRAMSLPGGTVQFSRPPSETRPALGDLIKAQPKNPDLFSLRALEDEQQLDFTAAESDWKMYAESASSKDAGQFALAEFYHRRARPLDEIKALEVVAASQA